jgi:hypothetical protein
MKFGIEIDGKRFGIVFEPGNMDAESIAIELGSLVERTYLYYYDGQGGVMDMEDSE